MLCDPKQVTCTDSRILFCYLQTATFFSGGRPVGFDEWRSLAAAEQSAAVPFDYPDTRACAALCQELQLAQEAAAAERPLGRATATAGLLPWIDWSKIGQTWQEDAVHCSSSGGQGVTLGVAAVGASYGGSSSSSFGGSGTSSNHSDSGPNGAAGQGETPQRHSGHHCCHQRSDRGLVADLHHDKKVQKRGRKAEMKAALRVKKEESREHRAQAKADRQRVQAEQEQRSLDNGGGVGRGRRRGRGGGAEGEHGYSRQQQQGHQPMEVDLLGDAGAGSLEAGAHGGQQQQQQQEQKHQHGQQAMVIDLQRGAGAGSVAAGAHGGQQQQQQEQQQQQQQVVVIGRGDMLLPHGWYVARSWRVIWSALGSRTATGSCGGVSVSEDTECDLKLPLEQQQQQGRVKGKQLQQLQEQSKRLVVRGLSGGGPSRRLNKALESGLVQWQEVRSCIRATGAGPLGAAGGTQGGVMGGAPGASTAPVTPTGGAAPARAAAAAAATVAAPSATAAAAVAAPSAAAAAAGVAVTTATMGARMVPAVGGGPGNAVSSGGSSSGNRCLVQVVVKVIGRGRCMEGTEIWGIDQGGQQGTWWTDAEAGAGGGGVTGGQQQQGQGRRRHGQGTGVYLGTLLGFVTTAVPRGAAGYPGGVGFCDVRGVWKVYGQRWESGGGWHRSSIRVLLRNPGSDAFREGQLLVSVGRD